MTALVLPFDQWPCADRDMWDALFLEGGLLDDAGPLSHLRPGTRRTLMLHYGRWLRFLQRQLPAALTEPPAARFTPDRMNKWLEDLDHTRPASRHMLMNATLTVLKGAKPASDWKRQNRVVRWLEAQAKNDHGQRKQGRVLHTGILLNAALQLAGPKAEAAGTRLKAAKDWRDGAMVALLALMPMRRRSFVELELGSSFDVTRQDMVVRLTGDMTKNGLPWEAPVPQTIQPILRQYLNEVRPWFLARGGQSTDVLWVDNRGSPYVANYFSTRIRKITLRITGVSISPHLFRDAAATTLARQSPKDAQLIRSLLAHATFSTAERHYIQASAIETGRDYAAILEDEFRLA